MSRVVLVVDDEPLVRDVTASMLEDMGCEVITAPNAKDALDKLANNPRIEILITDLNMPNMDGYALVDAAKQMREGLKVIAVSGQESNGSGIPVVRKPFIQEDLRRVMAQHTGLC